MMALTPHQLRIQEELEQLTAKIDALISFIESVPIFNTLHRIDRRLMIDQLEAMQTYQSILDKRMARFRGM